MNILILIPLALFFSYSSVPTMTRCVACVGTTMETLIMTSLSLMAPNLTAHISLVTAGKLMRMRMQRQYLFLFFILSTAHAGEIDLGQ